MDGNLDGEIVTQVSFNGINQDPIGAMKNGMFSQFIGLPFIFNVRIEAPFRGLLNTAMSFTDPSLLIPNSLGDGYEPVIRSEEHTSELQSQMRSRYAVFCSKKKKNHVYGHMLNK